MWDLKNLVRRARRMVEQADARNWADLDNLSEENRILCTVIGAYVLACTFSTKGADDMDKKTLATFLDRVPPDRADVFTFIVMHMKIASRRAREQAMDFLEKLAEKEHSEEN